MFVLSKASCLAVLSLLGTALPVAGLTALPIKVMVQTGLVAEFAPLYKGATSASTAMVPEAVTQPLHGTLELLPGRSFHWINNATWSARRVTWFRYVPSAAFTGLDSFTYRVNDGIAASNTEKCVIRVHPQEPGQMTVLLVVNSAILPSVSVEVSRLKADLESAGYQAKIKSYPDAAVTANLFNEASARMLWDTLRAEYDNPTQAVAGAMLIGRLPAYRPAVSQDESYWNMSLWTGDYIRDSMFYATRDSMLHYTWNTLTPDNTGYLDYDRNYDYDGIIHRGLIGHSLRHIWVSRFYALNSYGNGVLPYGDEATLLKRMLDANHDYRTGASRLPPTAWFFNDISKVGSKYMIADSLRALWPAVAKISSPLSVTDLIKPFGNNGGAIWDFNGHGNTNRMTTGVPGGGYNSILLDTVMNHPFQCRYVTPSACHIADPGQVFNRLFYTRGGGAVFGVGATSYVPASGYHNLGNAYPPNTRMRARLAAGDSWGRAWINSGMGLVSQIFYGDPSLKAASPWPSNELPRIDAINSAVLGSGRMRIMVSASDPDTGSRERLFEYWINRKYASGAGVPDTAAVGLSQLDFRFDSVTTVRVEVADCYKARWMSEFTVVPDSGIRIIRNLSLAADGRNERIEPCALTVGPNPFRPAISVRMALEKAGMVRFAVYDASGRLVQVLADGYRPAGELSLSWNGKNQRGRGVAAGFYMLRAEAAGRKWVRNLTLLK